MTDVNHELFIEVLAHIERNPDTWNQHAWVRRSACGTSYCFAGWAVVLGANAQVTQPGRVGAARTVINGEDIHVYEAACRLLGIPVAPRGAWSDVHGLFNQHCTLDDLYRISAEYLQVDEEVLRDKVRDYG